MRYAAVVGGWLVCCVIGGCWGDAQRELDQSDAAAPVADGASDPAPPEVQASPPVPALDAVKVHKIFDKSGGPMAISAAGDRLIMFGANRVDSDAGKQRVIIYDVNAGKLLHEFETSSAGIVPVSISPDGKLGAYLTRANFVHVVDVDTGDLRHEFKNDLLTGYYSYGLQIAPDGNSVWTYVEGANIASSPLGWNCETGKPLPTSAVEGMTVQSFCVLPEGTKVAVGYRNGELRIWDWAKEEWTTLTKGQLPEPDFSDNALERVRALAISPSGKLLAARTPEGNPTLLDLETKKIVREFPSGPGLSNDRIAFDPSGKWFVCQGNAPNSTGEAAADSVDAYPLHVFDVESGERLSTLNIPGNNLDTSIAWSLGWSGNLLYAGMSNGEVRVFDLSGLSAEIAPQPHLKRE